MYLFEWFESAKIVCKKYNISLFLSLFVVIVLLLLLLLMVILVLNVIWEEWPPLMMNVSLTSRGLMSSLKPLMKDPSDPGGNICCIRTRSKYYINATKTTNKVKTRSFYSYQI